MNPEIPIPKKRLKRLFQWLCFAVFACVLLVGGSNLLLISLAARKMTRDWKNVPVHEYAIVLGTSPGAKAAPNAFFVNRIATTVALWREGKIKRIIVSGDNGRKSYDEPTAMLNALVAQGVPAEAIERDYAGFRTLDSMFRAVTVFKVNKAILVTDDWHLPRALFLAGHAGIDATGVSSRDVPWKHSPETRIREVFSRVKSVLDIYVLRTKPHFPE